MDFEGWAMRLTVISRQYCRHEIAARVFGNRRWAQRVCVGGVDALVGLRFRLAW
jgi:hypothetical protein